MSYFLTFFPLTKKMSSSDVDPGWVLVSAMVMLVSLMVSVVWFSLDV